MNKKTKLFLKDQKLPLNFQCMNQLTKRTNPNQKTIFSSKSTSKYRINCKFYVFFTLNISLKHSFYERVFSKSKLSKCDSLPSMSSYLSKTNSEFKVELNKHRSAVFRDDKFKANRSSLYLRMEDSDPSYDKLIAKWSQLKDIIKPESSTNVKSSKPSVRSNSSSVEYKFRQGQLGNCWFLCSLASLVHKHPQHLSTLIPDMDLHLKEGIYQVNLCINGAWTSITVDDLFPCDMQNNLVFAQVCTISFYFSF